MRSHLKAHIAANAAILVGLLPSSMFVPLKAQVPAAPSLEQRIREKFKQAPRGADGQRMVEQGTRLVVQKAGIIGVPVGTGGFLPTMYKDGKFHPPNSVARAITVGGDQAQVPVSVGERVNLVNLSVNIKGDVLIFMVYSSDTRAAVSFHFPKGTLKNGEVAEVEEVIGQVFSVDASASNGPISPPVSQGAGKENPMAEPPPPPPPPADAPVTKTIEQGQTTQQVISALGQPEKIVKLGSKEIYFYKDLKVTFTDGKVTDVQ